MSQKTILMAIFMAAFAMAGLYAQPPASFNYQTVLRDDSGQPVGNEEVVVEIAILQGNPEGAEVFSETHQIQTNAFGLINLQIGMHTPLEGLEWGSETYFIQVSLNGQVMGTTQLLSVPYALYALSSADAFSGDYHDLENLPELSPFIQVENPQEGDLIFFDGENWQGIAIGAEGQVLSIANGSPQWTSLPGDETGTVTDIEGNVYQTVIIGEQEWMAENLKVTQYNDGTDIEYPGSNNSDWSNNTNGAYAWYNNDIDNKDLYGALYNWYAVDQASNGGRNICPAGWWVPADWEWDVLRDYLINNHDDVHTGNLANALKSCRQVNSPLGGECDTNEHPRWDADGTHYGIDAFGFAGLPGGRRETNGTFNFYGSYGLWWSSIEANDFASSFRALLKYDGAVFESQFFKGAGLSVRCVRDVE